MATWGFRQTTGAKKTIELSGASAPLGRPRKEAVVRDGIELRQATVYYPGSNGEPTRHIFGTKYEPWKIKGILRDVHLGKGGAKAKTEEIKAFVADAQSCIITWDDVVACNGLITSFSPGREASHEVEWTMTVDVSSDAMANVQRTPVAAPQLWDYSSQILAALRALTFDGLSLKGAILDVIKKAVGVINTVSAELNSIATSVQSFELATFAQLNRISSAVSQVKTAAFTVQESFASLAPDTAMFLARANNNLALANSQTAADDALRALLANLAEMDKRAAAARSGRIRTTYIVRVGDSWESVSVAFYGSADRSPDLQVANNSIGGKPKPGTEIRIPA